MGRKKGRGRGAKHPQQPIRRPGVLSESPQSRSEDLQRPGTSYQQQPQQLPEQEEYVEETPVQSTSGLQQGKKEPQKATVTAETAFETSSVAGSYQTLRQDQPKPIDQTQSSKPKVSLTLPIPGEKEERKQPQVSALQPVTPEPAPTKQKKRTSETPPKPRMSKFERRQLRKEEKTARKEPTISSTTPTSPAVDKVKKSPQIQKQKTPELDRHEQQSRLWHYPGSSSKPEYAPKPLVQKEYERQLQQQTVELQKQRPEKYTTEGKGRGAEHLRQPIRRPGVPSESPQARSEDPQRPGTSYQQQTPQRPDQQEYVEETPAQSTSGMYAYMVKKKQKKTAAIAETTLETSPIASTAESYQTWTEEQPKPIDQDRLSKPKVSLTLSIPGEEQGRKPEQPQETALQPVTPEQAPREQKKQTSETPPKPTQSTSGVHQGKEKQKKTADTTLETSPIAGTAESYQTRREEQPKPIDQDRSSKPKVSLTLSIPSEEQGRKPEQLQETALQPVTPEQAPRKQKKQTSYTPPKPRMSRYERRQLRKEEKTAKKERTISSTTPTSPAIDEVKESPQIQKQKTPELGLHEQRLPLWPYPRSLSKPEYAPKPLVQKEYERQLQQQTVELQKQRPEKYTTEGRGRGAKHSQQPIRRPGVPSESPQSRREDPQTPGTSYQQQTPQRPDQQEYVKETPAQSTSDTYASMVKKKQKKTAAIAETTLETSPIAGIAESYQTRRKEQPKPIDQGRSSKPKVSLKLSIPSEEKGRKREQPQETALQPVTPEQAPREQKKQTFEGPPKPRMSRYARRQLRKQEKTARKERKISSTTPTTPAVGTPVTPRFEWMVGGTMYYDKNAVILAMTWLQGISQEQPYTGQPHQSQGLPPSPSAQEPVTYSFMDVEVNYFSLNLGPFAKAFKNTFSLEPIPPKAYRRAIMCALEQPIPNLLGAYDGVSNIYSLNSVTDRGDKYRVTIDTFHTDNEMFTVHCNFKNTIKLHRLDEGKIVTSSLCLLNTVLCRPTSRTTLVNVDRCYFDMQEECITDVDTNLYKGYRQCVVQGSSLFLNVNVVQQIFYKIGTLIDIMKQLLNITDDQLQEPLNQSQINTLNEHVQKFRIIYDDPTDPKKYKHYKAKGLEEAARVYLCTLPTMDHLTIEEYYATVKGVSLQFPCLPTVWIKSIKRNKIVVPIELCYVANYQRVRTKLTDRQRRNLIQTSISSTVERKHKILSMVNLASFNDDPLIQSFGFKMGTNFEKVEAKVFNPPILRYFNDSYVFPSQGEWVPRKFYAGVRINKWAVVSVDSNRAENDLIRLINLIQELAPDTGIQITSDVTRAQYIGSNKEEIGNYFKDEEIQTCDVIFVIIPNTGPQYSYVKFAAEIGSHCLTQCIKTKTVISHEMHITKQCIKSILLKVNRKLNGINYILFDQPQIMNNCMIMGATLNHFIPLSKRIPSVAAVTASYDKMGIQYNSMWRLQRSREQTIIDLHDMVSDHLTYYYMLNNCYPDKIIFFRDGVDEKFEEAEYSEFDAIKDACKTHNCETISVTFVIVQRRHHTRFFPVGDNQHDAYANVKPGTCVDSIITSPFIRNFYLLSHGKVRGVARPTKYTIIDEDEVAHRDKIIDLIVMEKLVYYLCHLYARCNRSVSLPAPTYYAHLAADRARVYIRQQAIQITNLQRAHESFRTNVYLVNSRPMFYV